jgi:hypothetical protein
LQPVCDELNIGGKRARDAHCVALDAHPHLRPSFQQRFDEFAATPNEMPRELVSSRSVNLHTHTHTHTH